MAMYIKKNTGWCVRFKVKVDGVFRQRQMSGYRTKADAQLAYNKYISSGERDSSNRLKAEYIYFDDFLESYLTYLKTYRKESTYITVQDRIRLHIQDSFSGKRVDDITANEMISWQKELTRKKLSPKYINTLVTLLKSIMKHGMEIYSINANNPARCLKQIRDYSVKEELHTWTEDQFANFLSYVPERDYVLLFKTLFYTGMRKGEAQALQKSDLKDTELNVNKSLSRKTQEGPYTIWTPKNNSSIRKIDISRTLASELAKQRGPFLFGGDNPLAGTSIDRYFHKAVNDSGVPKIRIHDLRHSHASFLISKGLPITVVAQRLGHANIEQTLNTYAHMMPQDKDNLIRVLNE